MACATANPFKFPTLDTGSYIVNGLNLPMWCGHPSNNTPTYNGGIAWWLPLRRHGRDGVCVAYLGWALDEACSGWTGIESARPLQSRFGPCRDRDCIEKDEDLHLALLFFPRLEKVGKRK